MEIKGNINLESPWLSPLLTEEYSFRAVGQIYPQAKVITSSDEITIDEITAYDLDYSNVTYKIYEDISVDITDQYLSQSQKIFVSEYEGEIKISKNSFVRDQTLVVDEGVNCRIRTLISNPRIIKNSNFLRTIPNSDLLVEMTGHQKLILIKDYLELTDDEKCQRYIDDREDSRTIVILKFDEQGVYPNARSNSDLGTLFKIQN